MYNKIIALLVAMLSIQTACATTISVGSYGDNTTIQQAIDSASFGDVVWVNSGTYHESIVIDKTITLQAGVVGESILMIADEYDADMTITADGVTVDGFVFGQNSSDVYITGSNVVFTHNRLPRWGTYICLENNAGNVIENNLIGTYAYSVNPVSLFNSHDNRIVNNSIVYSHDYSMYLEGSDRNYIAGNHMDTNEGDAILLDGSDNNILVNNYNPDGYVYVYDGGVNNTVMNGMISEPEPLLPVEPEPIAPINETVPSVPVEPEPVDDGNTTEPINDTVPSEPIGDVNATDPVENVTEPISNVTEPIDNIGNITNETVVETVKNSSSSGGSGGGGGGSSGEAYENILVKEVDSVFVNNDAHVIYEFDDDNNPITTVEYDSKKNAGTIKTTVEVLNDISSLVDLDAPGDIYQRMNIWVGKVGYATENNVENMEINFKVELSWLEDNNILPEDVGLYQYADKTWNKLTVEVTNEDDTYVYYVAETPGFSAFTISGESTEEIETVSSKAVATVENEEIVPTSEPVNDKSNIMSYTLIGGLLVVGGAVFVLNRG